MESPKVTKWGNSSMESLGPGELKYGTTQTLFFIPSSSDIREITLGNHRPGETQAWNQPGWPRALKHGVPWATIKVRLASYLKIQPSGLTMAVKPCSDKVKLKYGNTQTPLSGETQVWNPSDLVSSSMASPRLSSPLGASSELSGNTADRPHYGR